MTPFLTILWACFIIMIIAVSVGASLVFAQNNTLLQNQANPYHLRHFHVLSTAEKTQMKIKCIKGELFQLLIAAVTKQYVGINDTASTAATLGPIYSVNPTFMNDSAAALWSCVSK